MHSGLRLSRRKARRILRLRLNDQTTTSYRNKLGSSSRTIEPILYLMKGRNQKPKSNFKTSKLTVSPKSTFQIPSPNSDINSRSLKISIVSTKEANYSIISAKSTCLTSWVIIAGSLRFLNIAGNCYCASVIVKQSSILFCLDYKNCMICSLS